MDLSLYSTRSDDYMRMSVNEANTSAQIFLRTKHIFLQSISALISQLILLTHFSD